MGVANVLFVLFTDLFMGAVTLRVYDTSVFSEFFFSLFFFFFFWESLTRTCLRDDMFHKFVIKAQYWHKQSWIINNLFMMECGVLLLISDLSTHFSFIHHFFSWKIFELQSITKRGMWTPSLPGFMRGCEFKCSVNVNEAFPPNFTAWQVGNPHLENRTYSRE